MSSVSDYVEDFDPTEVKDAMREDLNMHAATCMPDDAVCDYPDLFIQLWQLLLGSLVQLRDFSKFAVALPRGHGKTMFLKLLIAYIILFTDRKFVLIVCASEDLAQNILADVADMLDSENIHALFGNWRANLETDRKDFKKFSFNGRPVMLKAVGAQTSMRGITVKNKRPDVMIFDDAQTAKCAESTAESLKFIRWFRGTAMKAKNPFGCSYIYVGNMYPDLKIKEGQYTCMLRNLQLSPEWTSFVVGGILSNGEALWEEVQPLEQLMAEFRDDLAAGTPDIFYAEVMNDPAGSGNSEVDLTRIGIKDPLPNEMPQGKFIIIDPANEKDTSDATAIGYFEVFDATPNLDTLYNERLSGPQLVHKVLELASEKGCTTIFVESQAYQYSLVGWFDFICAQCGLTNIHVEPLYSGGRSKNSRILDMFKALTSGDLTLTSKTLPFVVDQIRKFNRLVKQNEDDILDILAYAEKVMGMHLDLLLDEGLGEVINHSDYASAPAVSHYSENLDF